MDYSGNMPLTKRLVKEIRQAATRHGRRKTGLFLCEGVRACQEAVAQRPDCIKHLLVTDAAHARNLAVKELVERCSRIGILWDTCSPAELQKLATTETPQGILLLCRRCEPPPPEKPLPGAFVLVLDRVRAPGNLGTMLRSASAVGVIEVWLTHGSTDPFGTKAVRSGMGAQFGLNLRQKDRLSVVTNELQKLGINRVWLSDTSAGISCYAPEFKLEKNALVIGSEAHGTEDLSGLPRVHIPMPGGIESLNAAQAATILMFETVRRSSEC